MAVLRPLKLVITNWPDDADGNPVVEHHEVVNNPENPADGVRQVPFSKVLYIEHDDFMEDAPPKYFRLTPGREVRLRSAYLVTCTGCVKDDDGNVIEVHCTYDPATSGGNAPDGRKVKSTMHWVSADHAVDATVALYDRLFSAEVPGEATGDPLDDLNPEVPRAADRLQGRAGIVRHAARLRRAVRTTRVLCPRSRDPVAVPSHGRPARRVGQHPEAELAPVTAASTRLQHMARGRLRVYLGAAPGVGKTHAMLEEGVRRAGRGADGGRWHPRRHRSQRDRDACRRAGARAGRRTVTIGSPSST